MGLALAEEAARRGAEVTLVAANVSLPAPAGVRVVDVETAGELLEAARAEFADADVLLMAAAVADFRPGPRPWTTRSRRAAATAWRSSWSRPRTCWRRWRPRGARSDAGRASRPSTARARSSAAAAKLERKGLDAVVVNDISRAEIGFDAADNEVTIVTAAGERHVPLGSKEAVAAAILDAVERASRRGPKQPARPAAQGE